jgi:DNA (cytosine-5)-methyltransferase 1
MPLRQTTRFVQSFPPNEHDLLFRRLLTHFFRVVAEVSPKFFVMENVDGVSHKSAKPILDHGISLVEKDFDVLGPIRLNAADFGAATKRPRVFVVGIRRDLGTSIPTSAFDLYHRPATTVLDAIGDLSNAKYRGNNADGFDEWQLTKGSKTSTYAKKMRTSDHRFTGNILTKHTSKVYLEATIRGT